MADTPAVADMAIGAPADGHRPGPRFAASLTSLRRFLDGRIPWLWLVLLAGAGATIGVWQLASTRIDQAAFARFEAVQQQTAQLIQSRLDATSRSSRGRSPWSPRRASRARSFGPPTSRRSTSRRAIPRSKASATWSGGRRRPAARRRSPGLRTSAARILPRSSTSWLSMRVITPPWTRRDSGMPTIAWALPSGAGAGEEPVDLVWLLPHYTRSASPATLEERREELRGLVFGLARLDDLPDAIVPPRDEIAIEIRAGSAPDGNDAVLYRSPELAPEPPARPRFVEEMVLRMHGQPWSLRFYSLPAFDADIDRLTGPVILGGGGLITLLLAALVRSLGRSRWAEGQAHATQLALEERARDLDHLNEELEQFVYVASHDLKAPLRGIDHLADWIEEDLGEALQGEARDNMNMLRRRVHRLETFLDDLLRYSRAGRQKPPIEWVDTGVLINETFGMLNAEERFELVVFGDSPRFATAKSALAQVLTNLFSNAIKHHDKPAGRIEVAVHDRGALCEIVVTDDGPGIPPEHQQRVFQMFQTLQPRDRVEGSGMGLALVRKLVTRHGGIITVDSNGRGAAFRFTWKKS